MGLRQVYARRLRSVARGVRRNEGVCEVVQSDDNTSERNMPCQAGLDGAPVKDKGEGVRHASVDPVGNANEERYPHLNRSPGAQEIGE